MVRVTGLYPVLSEFDSLVAHKECVFAHNKLDKESEK